MPRYFIGSYEQLQDSVLIVGLHGEWRDVGNQKQFRAENGAILNWWKSTHTVCFQGKEPECSNFEREFWSWVGFPLAKHTEKRAHD